MQLQTLIAECAEMSKSKGFDPTFPEFIALTHSELSEALEEFRKGKSLTDTYFSEDPTSTARKPEGIPVELADTVIRIAHYCGTHNIDLTAAIKTKLFFNATRPHKHGKVI